MYNLIITAEEKAWKKTRFELSYDRFLEYTHRSIVNEFKSLESKSIEVLKSIPTLLAYEAGVAGDARVCFLTQISRLADSISIKYKFLDEVLPIPSAKLPKLYEDLDISGFEPRRTHWAIKDIDLLEILSSKKLINKEAARRPSILVNKKANRKSFIWPIEFEVPRDEPESDLVVVMMPFESSFNLVYKEIRAACKELNLQCLRADDVWEKSKLIQDIFNLLYRSSIVIVDFSKKNPNVMYETGIAHTMGRTVIPLAQSLEDVPFDLRQHRILHYLPNKEGVKAMKKNLKERLIFILNERNSR